MLYELSYKTNNIISYELNFIQAELDNKFVIEYLLQSNNQAFYLEMIQMVKNEKPALYHNILQCIIKNRKARANNINVLAFHDNTSSLYYEPYVYQGYKYDVHHLSSFDNIFLSDIKYAQYNETKSIKEKDKTSYFYENKFINKYDKIEKLYIVPLYESKKKLHHFTNDFDAKKHDTLFINNYKFCSHIINELCIKNDMTMLSCKIPDVIVNKDYAATSLSKNFYYDNIKQLKAKDKKFFYQDIIPISTRDIYAKYFKSDTFLTMQQYFNILNSITVTADNKKTFYNNMKKISYSDKSLDYLRIKPIRFKNKKISINNLITTNISKKKLIKNSAISADKHESSIVISKLKSVLNGIINICTTGISKIRIKNKNFNKINSYKNITVNDSNIEKLEEQKMFSNKNIKKMIYNKQFSLVKLGYILNKFNKLNIFNINNKNLNINCVVDFSFNNKMLNYYGETKDITKTINKDIHKEDFYTFKTESKEINNFYIFNFDTNDKKAYIDENYINFDTFSKLFRYDSMINTINSDLAAEIKDNIPFSKGVNLTEVYNAQINALKEENINIIDNLKELQKADINTILNRLVKIDKGDNNIDKNVIIISYSPNKKRTRIENVKGISMSDKSTALNDSMSLSKERINTKTLESIPIENTNKNATFDEDIFINGDINIINKIDDMEVFDKINKNIASGKNIFIIKESKLTKLYPKLKKFMSDKALKEVYLENGVFVRDNKYDQPDFKLTGIDELILPYTDYDYSILEDQIIKDGKVIKYEKQLNDKTFIITTPIKHPIPKYNKTGLEFININVSLLSYMIDITYNLWMKQIYKTADMDMKDTMQLLLDQLDTYISITLNEEYRPQGYRILRLIRWYGEAAINSYAKYKVTLKYKPLDSALYTGDCQIPYEFENMNIDTKMYTITNTQTNIPCSCTFDLYNPVDSKVSFILQFNKGTATIKINNEIVDTVENGRNNLSYNIDKVIDNKPNKLQIFYDDKDGGIINVSKVVLSDNLYDGYELEYEPFIGASNKAMDTLIKQLTAYDNVYINNKEDIEKIALNNYAVSDVITRLTNYFNLHHTNKTKGKRLTIKK